MESLLFQFILIIAGLIGLVYSADKFVDGASSVAMHLKLSPLFIGVVLVGIGTSAPEIVVSAQAALGGKPELSFGNAVGSNIANIALIIGATALFTPIVVHWPLVKKEIFILACVTVLSAFFIFDGSLVRFEAILFILALGFILYFLMTNSKNETTPVEETPSYSSKKSWVVTIVGMIALVGFSKMLVTGAVGVASYFGVSELIIGLTIIAIGTSLPELATSITAAKKGSADLAIGNVIGSNIFNMLAVLSVSSMIKPFDIPKEALSRDMPLMIILTFVFILMAFSFKSDRGVVNRVEGFILLTIFIAYIVALVLESLGIINISPFLFGL